MISSANISLSPFSSDEKKADNMENIQVLKRSCQQEHLENMRALTKSCKRDYGMDKRNDRKMDPVARTACFKITSRSFVMLFTLV